MSCKFDIWYKQITGIAFVVIYLIGVGFSIYSSRPASHIPHEHTYCSVSFCGCAHEADHCNCDHVARQKAGELNYSKCKNPIAESYIGISISSFLTENLYSFQTHLFSKYISEHSSLMSSQTSGDSQFHPPQAEG